jgi:hypothetical protein
VHKRESAGNIIVGSTTRRDAREPGTKGRSKRLNKAMSLPSFTVPPPTPRKEEMNKEKQTPNMKTATTLAHHNGIDKTEEERAGKFYKHCAIVFSSFL